ncbi:MAG: potassium-transporting ATPase subunit KdpA [Gemmatimonadales bacterium]
MTGNAWLQLTVFIVLLTLLALPLGRYIAAVFRDGPVAGWPGRIIGPLERRVLRLIGSEEKQESAWSAYARDLIVFSVVSTAGLYLLQRLQSLLPGNPADLPPVSPLLALNTAISFVANTNWQAYGGETTLSYVIQAAGLGVQNFVSAAAGVAVLIALVRGLARQGSDTIGNFWVDLTRGTLYLLIPLSVVMAVALVAQGVVQTWDGPAVATTLEGAQQTIARGPAASQIAIKQLGTNGGGFFNTNSAHPFENPTPLSNLLELLAILLIPAALCHTLGRLLGDRRHGWVYFGAMTVLFVPLAIGTIASEQYSTPALAASAPAAEGTSGGNMEGKEVRFGIVNSALWAAATTAASSGSVNSMHDSFTPLGGLIPLWLMLLGEVVFGGVGSGLYGMVIYGILAVFLAGLMVGRTPEYLGKKIGAFEIRMAALVILVPALLILLGTALAVATDAGRAGAFNAGPHGFSEILYGMTSAAANNGSAFGGLGAASPFYLVTQAIAMWLGRFFLAIPVLAIAGTLAKKRATPAGPGTLPTTGPLFLFLLVGTVVLLGALTFLPALALGPIAEHFMMVMP